MRKATIRLICILCACAMLTAASADSLSLSGTVTAAETWEVYAPIGGTVDRVEAEVGQTVGAGDVLLSFRTNKVYAEEGGVVTGIFGEPGDSAETVAGRYGAVLYLEEDSVYTVSASTESAYNSTETKFVHMGETVYLQGRSNASRSGEGVITAIEGTGYTVKVTSGTFIPGDSVDIFRNASYSNSQKVGRGTVARKNPTAVTAGGSIVSIAVKDGQRVEKGELLLETLEGSFDGFYMSGTQILAGQAGIIQSLNAEQGGSVQKNAVVAVICPEGSARVEAELPEDSLADVAVGDKVLIELETDESKTYEGTVTMISGVASAGQSGEVTYRMLVSFTPDSAVRYGMSVVINTLEADSGTEETVADEALE